MASTFKNRMQAANLSKKSAEEEVRSVMDNRDYGDDGKDKKKEEDPESKGKGVGDDIKEEAPREEGGPSIKEVTDQNNGYEKKGAIPEKEEGSKDKRSTIFSNYEDMPYKTVTLIPEFHRILKVRSKQLGLTKDGYLNLILSEENDRIKKIEEKDMDGHYRRIYTLCDKRFREPKERSNIRFSQIALDFIERETTNSGVSFAAYMNYLMEKEIKREEKEGKRAKIG